MAFIFNTSGTFKEFCKNSEQTLKNFEKGDSIVDWYTSKFQMFKNGSYWQPPQINRFTRCGRNDSYEKAKSELVDKKGQLSDE